MWWIYWCRYKKGTTRKKQALRKKRTLKKNGALCSKEKDLSNVLMSALCS